MIAQVSYWLNCLPGQQLEGGGNVMMSANGGLLIGSWAIETPSDKVNDVLTGLKAYVRPLVKLETSGEIMTGQRMRLDALRQFRWVLERLNRDKYPNGATFQLIEPMESQHLNIVHNVKVEYV